MELCGHKEPCFVTGENWGHFEKVLCRHLGEREIDGLCTSVCLLNKGTVASYISQEEHEVLQGLLNFATSSGKVTKLLKRCTTLTDKDYPSKTFWLVKTEQGTAFLVTDESFIRESSRKEIEEILTRYQAYQKALINLKGETCQ